MEQLRYQKSFYAGLSAGMFRNTTVAVGQRGNEVNDLRIGNKRDHAQGFDPAWQKDAAYVHPWNHTYDGTYSEVDATWHGVSVKLSCAAEKDTLVMLVTPLEGNA